MKKYLALLTVTLLVLSPAIARTETGQETVDGPPVAQTLVREGDLAVELTDALNLGPVGTEEEAESVLTSVGIAPRNGWVSDYPVTPDVIGELQAVSAAAADSNALGLYRDHALAAFGDLLDQLGLPPITTDDSDQYTEDTQPPMSAETGSYVDSGGLDDYYNGFGPPVVTYYTPPGPYYPLYSWVSYPFWCHKVFFPGFFVLRRFHCIQPVAVVRHHGTGVVIISRPVRKVVTNRVVDPATHKVVIIDPPRRSTDRAFRFVPSSSTAKFATVQPGRGSNVVMERSHSNQVRNSSTQAVVVNGPLGRGTALTSEGPKHEQPSSSLQVTRNNPTRVVSTPSSSQVVGRTAVPQSTEVLPANRGSAPERSGSVGYGWGNAGTGFGAGRMESFGSRGGFGRR